MKGRGLVVVLALIMATIATVGVYMYTNAPEEPAGEQVPVVVSKVDIPARSDLGTLVKDDQFKIIQVPKVAVVDGAVTSIDQLRDKHNSVAILAGEQIPVARIVGEGTVPGGVLGIPDGHEAITMSVDASRAVAGAIQPGDNVTLYGTFSEFSTPAGKHLPTMTTVVIPTAQVLSVGLPVTGEDALGVQQTQQTTGSVSLTLALTPQDAARFVFTMETGSVWLGLLPPDTQGARLQRVTFVQVVK
jgi:pilus assembly protein CpaB